MSRAVIDQSGFRILFIGIVTSLIFGLAIKSQISQKKIQDVIQQSLSHLDKDFIIDFKTAEVKLSNWGFPIPFLEITQIRLSPKKAICQDSQLYIEKLNVPLSLISLITSKSIIDEISASNVELRIAEVSCLKNESKTTNKASVILNESGPYLVPEAKKQTPETDSNLDKNIFQLQTAALLKKIKIDQLKLIFKNYPKQALELHKVQLDLSYLEGHLNKILLNSTLNALKDPLSNLVYFRGDLSLQISASQDNKINAEAKLNGRLLDGQIQAYFFYDGALKKLKSDFTFENVSLKPFNQLNLIDSPWLNYPVALNFQGLSEHQFDENEISDLYLKNIQVTGERIFIQIPKMELHSKNNNFNAAAFEAEIKQLNLNKLGNISPLKNIAQSIENFGEFSGTFKYVNNRQMDLKGLLSNVEFIFSNRGHREILKIDNFGVDGNIQNEAIHLKLSNFILNNNSLLGTATIQHNTKTQDTVAEAQLSGKLLTEKIWVLLTETTQNPDIKLHWSYKKADQERHQVYLYAENLKSQGIVFENPEIQMIQSIHNNLSSGLALTIKAPNASLDSSLLEADILKQLFKSSVLSEKTYLAEYFIFNLKGADWKNMNFDMETKLKPNSNDKFLQTLKAKGEWKQDDSVDGVITIQNPNSLIKRYELQKKSDSTFLIQDL